MTSETSLNRVLVDQPKAVVLIFGWLGGQIRHVNKYAAIYNRLGCCTIAGVADSVAIMTSNQQALETMAVDAACQAAAILQNHPTVPLVVHCFSNGGAFVVEHLELVMQRCPNDDDLQLCRERLQLQLFDSAPAYMHISSGMRAIGSSVTNSLVRWLAVSCFLIFGIVSGVVLILLGRPGRPKQFWTRMSESRAASKQVFFYSTSDNITDHVKIEELIARRRGMGVDVKEYKFEDSGHVAHYRKHPKVYEQAIEAALVSLKQYRRP